MRSNAVLAIRAFGSLRVLAHRTGRHPAIAISMRSSGSGRGNAS
jgi:hypothetical protein